MAINSRAKGAKGERELANLISDRGYRCIRGQQRSGLEQADVIGLDYIHIECKRVQNLNLDKAMEQSIRDRKAGEMATVFHRKNNQKWKVTLGFEDFMTLYDSYYSDMKLKEMEERDDIRYKE
jgi:Holliday junction resolvase